MQIKRTLALGTALFTLAAVASAQFDGPAPVAWRWTQPTAIAPLGSPVVDGNTVFTAVGQRAYALDKDSGNQKWRFPAGEPIEGYFRAGVLKICNTIVAAADNRSIFGIDAETGASKWQYVLPVPVIGQPVVVEGNVVVALSDNSLMAVRASDGTPTWSAPYKVFDGLNRNIGSHGGSILMFTSTGEMRAIDVITQKTLWRQRFSQIGPDTIPVIFGDNVYVTSGPFIAALSAITGAGRGQIDTREQLGFAPAVSAEGVVAITREGKALGFDLNLSRMLFNPIDLGSLPSVRPSGVGSMFLAPTTNGALNLIDPKTGKITWSYLVRPTISASGKAGTAAAGGGNTGGPTAGGAGQSGGGALGGGGGALGGGGGAQTPASNVPVLAVAASGPAVLAGSTLLVLVEDGSLLAFDKKSGVDLTSPEVTMLWPNMGDQVSGQPPLELIFKIDDEASGINTASLKIDVDGTTLDHVFGRDGIAWIRISSIGKNKPLNNGRKKITVTVSDWLGNETRRSYALTVDNSLKPLVRPTGGAAGAAGAGGGPKGGGGGVGR